MARGVKAGRIDNTVLEARPNVLTYTTTALEQDVEVIGKFAVVRHDQRLADMAGSIVGCGECHLGWLWVNWVG